jgi:hypothetical protein
MGCPIERSCRCHAACINFASWPHPDARNLVLQYEKSTIAFYTFAHRQRWFLVGDRRSEDSEISQDDALKLLPPGTKSIRIPFFEPYGMIMLLGLFALLIGVSAYSLSGN